MPIVALVFAIAVGAVAVKHGRHHVFPKRFAVVVPGQLYRSGLLEAGPLRNVIEDHDIRTILTLLNEDPNDPDQRDELAIAADNGIRVIRIGMPGDGRADYDSLERAAAIVADSANYPLLVHCHAGVNRTGAVYAVWRMKYCGWDVDRAIAEAEQRGYDPSTNPELIPHLRAYYGTRIAASQPAAVTTTRPTGADRAP